jgi:aminopeptidase
VLEDLAPRPLIDMPAAVLADMETSQVSIFAVQVQTNELGSRMQMTDVVNRRHMRHAHMVNITRGDHVPGHEGGLQPGGPAEPEGSGAGAQGHADSRHHGAGTDITAEMNPGYKWFKTSGIISPEKWGNLPGGECFTSPGEVNGRFVVDGVVGDWLCARYGLLAATPL